MYSDVLPDRAPNPSIYVYNARLSEYLGLDVSEWMDPLILSGSVTSESYPPIVQAYAGHQFGHFTVLGDGRAIVVREILGKDGKLYDVQLKGSGRTPYSGGDDGKATLSTMLREYVMGEAMQALGIPTTRGLAVTLTGEEVYRNGSEEGAVLARVASSHIRVGTFQYASLAGTLEKLADYTIRRHYPDCAESGNPYLCLLDAVVAKQASLIAKWQSVGFIHGVINTDNMLVSGETIDHGPCAFMESYSPETVFSSIDRNGRYAYGRQPAMGKWNLARFAESLLPLISEGESEAVALATESVEKFDSLFWDRWIVLFLRKIGLEKKNEGNTALIEDFLALLHNNGADFTNSFLALTQKGERLPFAGTEEGSEWLVAWKSAVEDGPSWEKAGETMRRSNPQAIPRNHMVEKALAEARAGRREAFDSLVEVVRNPFREGHPPEYMEPDPKGAEYVTFCGT